MDVQFGCLTGRRPSMIECGRCGFRNSDAPFFCKSCGMRLVSSDVLPDDAKQAGIADLRSVVKRLNSARPDGDGPWAARYPTLPPGRQPHVRLLFSNYLLI